MEARAIHRNARIAPRKVRLLADLVRGMPVQRALEVLAFSRRRAGPMIAKVVNSAVANAAHNKGANPDDLIISEITVDQGPTLKRFMPRAMGRATRIEKKTSHISVIVSEG